MQTSRAANRQRSRSRCASRWKSLFGHALLSVHAVSSVRGRVGRLRSHFGPSCIGEEGRSACVLIACQCMPRNGVTAGTSLYARHCAGAHYWTSDQTGTMRTLGPAKLAACIKCACAAISPTYPFPAPRLPLTLASLFAHHVPACRCGRSTPFLDHLRARAVNLWDRCAQISCICGFANFSVDWVAYFLGGANRRLVVVVILWPRTIGGSR